MAKKKKVEKASTATTDAALRFIKLAGEIAKEGNLALDELIAAMAASYKFCAETANLSPHIMLEHVVNVEVNK